MAAARGIDRCEAAMMVLDAEQKAKLSEVRKPRREEQPPPGDGDGDWDGDV